jgi:chorismate mutase
MSQNKRRHSLLIGTAVLAATALGGPQAMAVSPGQSATPKASVDAGFQPIGPLGPLTGLAIRRIQVSDQVAASKFGTNSPIDDPAREQQELDAVRQQATALGLDPAVTVQFFQDQITASKVIQKGLFKRWEAHPHGTPTTRPDLNQIRTQLDRLTTEILQQLQATEKDRHATLSCTIQLAEATLSGEIVNHFDALHRQALETALQSGCSPA